MFFETQSATRIHRHCNIHSFDLFYGSLFLREVVANLINKLKVKQWTTMKRVAYGPRKQTIHLSPT